MLRLAWIDVDRMHTDPTSGVPVDTVTMSGTTITRGTTVSTTSLAYTILALRTTLRSLSSQLELYSNNTPDGAIGTTPLDTVAIKYPGDGTKTFTGRLAEMLKADGDLLYDHLTTADGHAFVGWDVSSSAPIDMTDTLDAHTAAVRGLFAAWLATDDIKYQQRAIAVFDRLETVFYDPSARIYTATPAPVDTVVFTPVRFALLQSTLRDAYELLAVRADGAALEPDLESRVARRNKLVLNGWDDANEDRNVDWPGECVNVVGGLPRGGLQDGRAHAERRDRQPRRAGSTRRRAHADERPRARLRPRDRRRQAPVGARRLHHVHDPLIHDASSQHALYLRRALVLAAALALGASSCGSSSPSEAAVIVTGAPGAHTSSIAISSDGATLYVVNADADSISILDAKGRKLVREVLLAGAHPAVDASGAYTPSVLPRAITISPDGATLYVVGERSGKLYAVDAASGAISGSVAVGSEPIGVVLSADGSKAFVAASQDAVVARVDVATMTVEGTATVSAKPWALTWSADGTALLVTHLLGPGVTSIDPTLLVAGAPWTLPDVAPRGDKRLAHGTPRGIFDVAVRPGASPELWVLDTLLGIDTAQPRSRLPNRRRSPRSRSSRRAGVYGQTISTDAQDVPGVDGAFVDVVSGPHAMAFTDDGAYALVVDTASEDVLVIDASQRLEVSVLRPLPGHMPEGIVLSPDGATAYVDERNTADVAVLQVDRTGGSLALTVDGAPIARLAKDPMPAQLRLGQHLFESANSDEYPITQNHWVACASCHMEGRSDAVTWEFAQGPRDTPSNAGGTLGTGLLFRTADRRVVQDYFRTIDTEQGGSFTGDDPSQKPLLDALEAFVDHAIPLPIPPTTDPALVAQGKVIFERSDVGCATCHSGPRFTDSGLDNPTLDLAKANLHDVGTCVTAPYPDVAHDDIDDVERAACQFDTPSLNGVADSAPYLHDGSAATLRDVLEQTRGKMGDISSLSEADLDALVEYLRSL